MLLLKYKRGGETVTVDAIEEIVITADRVAETVTRWVIPKAGQRFIPLWDAATAQYGLPLDLLPAVAWRESRYRDDIIDGRTRSSAGAVGLMQIIPKWHPDLGEAGALDPARAIPYAAKYLRDLYRQFKHWPTAIAAYNFGPGNVADGKAWPAETRTYVAEVAANAGLA